MTIDKAEAPAEAAPGDAAAAATAPLLTDAEAALYDRQLRVWGVEAQKRLSASKVVIVGSRCLAAEVAKNLVLAGVGGVTLIDDSFGRGGGGGEARTEATTTTTTTTATTTTTTTTTTTAGEAAASGNFLVAAALAAAKEGGGEAPPEISSASPAAEAAAAALREMNPHVAVSVARFPSPSASSSSAASDSAAAATATAAAAAALCPGELAKVFEGAAAVVYACGLGGGSGGSGSGKAGNALLPFSSLHAALAADAAASAAGVPFFWGGVAGSQGFFFVNLHEHEFEVDNEESSDAAADAGTKKVGQKRKAAAEATATEAAAGDEEGGQPQRKKKALRRRAFASLERLLSHPWAGLHPRRTHALVYGLRTVFEWEARRAREGALEAAATTTTTEAAAATAATTEAKKAISSPSLLPLPSASDLPLLLEAGHALASGDGVAPHALPAFADDGALSLLARDCAGGGGRQHPAVAAVVGGALANDVVRAVSKKGAPAVDNLFCFSLADGKGVVERLGEVNREAEEKAEKEVGGGAGGKQEEGEGEDIEVV